MNGNKTPTATIVETIIATPDQRKAFAEFCAESAFPVPNAPVRPALSCTEQQRADGTRRWTPLPKPRTVTLDVEDVTSILDAIHALAEVVANSSHRYDAEVAFKIAHHAAITIAAKHDLPEAQ